MQHVDRIVCSSLAGIGAHELHIHADMSSTKRACLLLNTGVRRHRDVHCKGFTEIFST